MLDCLTLMRLTLHTLSDFPVCLSVTSVGFARHATILTSVIHRVHRVLEKSLKVLEFWKKIPGP